MNSASREACVEDIHFNNQFHPLLRLVSRRFRQHGVSALKVQLRSGEIVTLGQPIDGRFVPTVRLNRVRAIARGWFGGLLGWAEGYMAGDWDTDQPIHVTDWALDNEVALETSFSGNSVSTGLNRLVHRLRANTRRGSRRNIAQHYDLGNDFYRLWLDPSMTYSSALYTDPSADLQTAQVAKYQRVIEMLGASSDGDVLEIGCGWGGFAETWARQCTGRLHGITLSAEQLAYARQRMERFGGSNTEFSLTDYRDAHGSHDGIVSIEMFEAVGEENWPLFFDTLRRRLRPGGAAVVQTITIADERFDTYRRNTDFVQRYIFPGGMLPSPSRFRSAVEAAGLRLAEVQTFGPDYARTLASWNESFQKNWPAVEALGFDDRFRRMWSYYLAYCESGFKHGAIDVQLCRIERD